MLDIEFTIGFVFGLITGLTFWGIHAIYRRLRAKRSQKEHDGWWAWKEPYFQ